MSFLGLKSLSLGNLETRLYLLHSPALAGLSCHCFTRSDMQQCYCSVYCLLPAIRPSFWSLQNTEAQLCFEKPQPPPKSASCSSSQLETQHAFQKSKIIPFSPCNCYFRNSLASAAGDRLRWLCSIYFSKGKGSDRRKQLE